MPIYEYICTECSQGFEQLHLSSRETVSCPRCNGNKVDRRLSVFASPSGASEGDGTEVSQGGCSCTPSTCGCH